MNRRTALKTLSLSVAAALGLPVAFAQRLEVFKPDRGDAPDLPELVQILWSLPDGDWVVLTGADIIQRVQEALARSPHQVPARLGVISFRVDLNPLRLTERRTFCPRFLGDRDDPLHGSRNARWEQAPFERVFACLKTTKSYRSVEYMVRRADLTVDQYRSAPIVSCDFGNRKATAGSSGA